MAFDYVKSVGNDASKKMSMFDYNEANGIQLVPRESGGSMMPKLLFPRKVESQQFSHRGPYGGSDFSFVLGGMELLYTWWEIYF